MNINSLQPGVNAASLPFEQLAGNPNVSESDKVKQACRQFEAVLLRQILSEANKTTLGPKSEDSSAISGIYKDMINNQFADSISKSGAFGLAKSLETQLVHQVLPQSGDARGTSPAAANTTKTP
jgi:Rod binding domain-containing protein